MEFAEILDYIMLLCKWRVRLRRRFQQELGVGGQSGGIGQGEGADRERQGAGIERRQGGGEECRFLAPARDATTLPAPLSRVGIFVRSPGRRNGGVGTRVAGERLGGPLWSSYMSCGPCLRPYGTGSLLKRSCEKPTHERASPAPTIRRLRFSWYGVWYGDARQERVFSVTNRWKHLSAQSYWPFADRSPHRPQS
jgi:hypothetical protein